ncbi:flavodoxin [Paenibacillus marchantiophytorum]|uniref:Flavodoxin n=1 Tax=Paenibacillus marchantiophytorum TaxID=1619310 RepID=A0ABQ1F5T0_9BACL|nr:flavodoxin [Paenibacillus marchantiophytorum]GGA00151.1 flavodoxin [Paenibacillus marchantiophytorum]
MSSVIVVFASMTGNTEEMAEAIAEGLQEAGIEPVVKNVIDTNAEEITKYDGIILGSYTWGDGDLADDFLDFYDEMDVIQLDGKKAAVFGSADSSYAEYGAAVDTLITKLKELGAEVTLDGLKVELSPSKDDKVLCREFGKQFVQSLGA